jgi:hypothetical protein
MPDIYRWYIKTTEDEILDGPFQTSEQADRARIKHFKTYKYDPVIGREWFEKPRRDRLRTKRAKTSRGFNPKDLFSRS